MPTTRSAVKSASLSAKVRLLVVPLISPFPTCKWTNDLPFVSSRQRNASVTLSTSPSTSTSSPRTTSLTSSASLRSRSSTPSPSRPSK